LGKIPPAGQILGVSDGVEGSKGPLPSIRAFARKKILQEKTVEATKQKEEKRKKPGLC
jgi:hypothetical protein